MSNTLEALKRGVKAGIKAALEPIKPQKYKVAGKGVRCAHCAGEEFELTRICTETQNYTALECSRCSHLELFRNGKVVVEDVRAGVPDSVRT